jgi:hypothetical protein
MTEPSLGTVVALGSAGAFWPVCVTSTRVRGGFCITARVRQQLQRRRQQQHWRVARQQLHIFWVTRPAGTYQTANLGLRRQTPLLLGSPRAPPLMYRIRPRGRELGSSDPYRDLPAGGGVEAPLIQHTCTLCLYSRIHLSVIGGHLPSHNLFPLRRSERAIGECSQWPFAS